MTDGDETLVVQSQRGDRAAFEELVRRCARLLYSRLYLDTGDVHRAEDLVQETFLRAWRSLGELKDPRTFRPWLQTIAHKAMLDAIKAQKRKKRSTPAPVDPDSDPLMRIAASDPGPPELAQQHEQRQRVLTILRSLPHEYREPLMLRYIAGADYETISRQLALSNGSLRGLLQRGMALLREKLNDAR